MAGVASGHDVLTAAERSEHMARVRGKGNASTEGVVADWLRSHEIEGWVSHPTGVRGRPDFYFPELRLAVFVDGCFWHGCPTCDRNVPRTRTEFWRKKIEATRSRDRRVTRKLRGAGEHVLRLWEHELQDKRRWNRRLRQMITSCRRSTSGGE